jgi:hypothetical protein
VFAMINLTIVLLNVSSLVIPQLKRDIVIIVLFFASTLLAPMSHLLSLIMLDIFVYVFDWLNAVTKTFVSCVLHFWRIS